MNYQVNRNEETGQVLSTSFTLAKGTKFALGDQTIELADDATFVIEGAELSRDAIVETIIAGGQSAANNQNFAFSEGGKNYTYNGRGQRVEVIPEPVEEEAAEPAPKKAAKKKAK